MKRRLALLLCLVMALSLIPAAAAEDIEIVEIEEEEPLEIVEPGEPEPAEAETAPSLGPNGDLAVDASNFPDANFRSYVADKCDTDGNGYLSYAEIIAVTKISVYGKNISSMTGVSNFTRLKELYCGGNQISSLNVKNLTELESLYCYNNPNLTRLDIHLSSLKDLDVYNNTELTELSCTSCSLRYLNVQGCTGLKKLYCSNNSLKKLDASGDAALSILYCDGNQLTELYLNGCTALNELHCDGNPLTELNLNGCTALKELYCYNNQLTELSLTDCQALEIISCHDNGLTELNLSDCTALNNLHCANNQLTALNVSSCPALARLRCNGNSIAKLDISASPSLVDVYLNGTRTVATESGVSFYKYKSDSNYLFVDLSTEINTVPKPTITTQPKSQSVAEGGIVLFTVTADGAESYQWQYRTSSSGSWKNSSAASAKTANFYFTAESYRNGYQYRCKVSNSAGTTTSKAATLTIVTKPTISTQPKSQSAKEGETVKFTVAASGGGLSYQWYYRTSSGGEWKESTGTGATSKTLSVEAKAYRGGYQYRCKVSNDAGYKYSSAATLTVLTKPAITTQPSSKSVSAGTTVKFTVKATGGDLSYQWYYRTSSSGEWKKCTGTGATTATLSVEAKSYRNGYQYRCKVSNDVGYKYSSAATLTVK